MPYRLWMRRKINITFRGLITIVPRANRRGEHSFAPLAVLPRGQKWAHNAGFACLGLFREIPWGHGSSFSSVLSGLPGSEPPIDGGPSRPSRIEIMFGRLTDWRLIATRHDRCAKVFLSAVALAATVIVWL
jgi:hypothetical protein